MGGVCSRMSTIGNRSSMRNAMNKPRHQRKMKRHVALVAAALRRNTSPRPPAIGSPRPATCGRRIFRPRARAVLSERRASPADFRSWCPRARKDTARRPAASRPRRGRARNPPTLNIASWTSGLSKFKSGWCEKKRCQKYALAIVVPRPVGNFHVLEDDAGFLVFLRACRSRRKNSASGCRAWRGARAETTDAGRRCGSAPVP